MDSSGERKIYIGDVLVCSANQANPYHGSLVGPERVEALRAFCDGSLPAELAVWHAPACGGARRLLDPGEVNWIGLHRSDVPGKG